MASDLRSLSRLDQAFLGLGALLLIVSFLPWSGWTVNIALAGKTYSPSNDQTVWHGGLATWGLVLMLIATAIVFVQLTEDASLPEFAVSWALIAFVLDALGAVFILVRSFNLPSKGVPGFSVVQGLRWGGWLLLVVAIAQVVVGALRLRPRSEVMPLASGAAPES